MDRQKIVADLAAFRKELETDGILQDDIGMSLLFSDILDAMGLERPEVEAVLGEERVKAIREWENTRAWLVEHEKREAMTDSYAIAPLVA